MLPVVSVRALSRELSPRFLAALALSGPAGPRKAYSRICVDVLRLAVGDLVGFQKKQLIRTMRSAKEHTYTYVGLRGSVAGSPLRGRGELLKNSSRTFLGTSNAHRVACPEGIASCRAAVIPP